MIEVKARVRSDEVPLRQVDNPAELLHKAGLIYEINRKILHPLGLALYFVDRGENGEERIDPGLGVLDSGGEPIVFDLAPGVPEERERQLQEFMAKRGAR